ncbi:hypothetical protein Gohar_024739 [Gossypium harknessii]|uniref:Annexin n=1 Tax=Gossypium harknessii TaxID=34285 RepID=A0A7J9HJG5_9ROSI|nr:hypothetical protein [Gossypium harknessii]
MHEPGERDAFILKKALKGAVKDQKAVTEIVCSRTPSQIGQLKRAYFSNVGSNLEDDIEAELSGEHKKLLLAFLTTSRYEGPEYDESLVEEDAKALNKAARKFGLAGKTFIQIFSDRSRAHLCAVSDIYKTMFKKTLEKALRKAMKGIGTADTDLIRIVVTRAEVDMHYIKAEYRKKYGKTLNDAVYSDTSGHYRTFLLFLLGNNN